MNHAYPYISPILLVASMLHALLAALHDRAWTAAAIAEAIFWLGLEIRGAADHVARNRR